MESKWYFFPGQTTENTKIADRAHALHITRSAWKGITQHLDRKKRIQEAIDRERAHKESLKLGSQAMTKEWINSIENLRLKKEGERHDRISKKKEDKIQMFYKMRDEQEVLRKQYIDKVRKEVFVSTGYPRELTGALITSETLYERGEQLKFNEKIRKHNEEVKKQADEEILARGEREKQEDQEQKQKKLEQERKVAQMIKEQVIENEETRKAANRARIEKETLDNIKAAKENELIKQFELDQKRKKRGEIALSKKKALDDERARQKMLAKEEAEMIKATQFYSEARKHIECLMKSKEKEMKEETLKYRNELAHKVAAMQEDKEAAENARIATAVAERNAEEQANIKMKEENEARAIKERIEDRKHYLEKLGKRNYLENELKKWEMLNRHKTEERNKEYNKEIRKEKWAKILEYRRDLLEQIDEDKQIRIREKEIDDIMSRVSFEEADKMFFDYAQEVLQLAKSKNRLLYPIEKVINEYKKHNSLEQKERRCKCYYKKNGLL